MTDDDRELTTGQDRPEATEDDEGPAPTPFDNPFFLPVILLGFAVWLGYDGWINQSGIQAWRDADEAWKVTFNQYGAGIAGVLGAYSLYRALQERKANAARSGD